MTNRLKKSPAPRMAGDQVLSCHSVYLDYTGHGKLLCAGGDLQQFTVLALGGGVATIQDATGTKRLVHESLLKVCPCVHDATDDAARALASPRSNVQRARLQHLASFYSLASEPDGACFFKAMAMARQNLSGIQPNSLTDNGEVALQVRRQLVAFSHLWVQGLSAEQLSEAEALPKYEFLDDPARRRVQMGRVP